jgi:hypothetical protein
MGLVHNFAHSGGRASFKSLDASTLITSVVVASLRGGLFLYIPSFIQNIMTQSASNEFPGAISLQALQQLHQSAGSEQSLQVSTEEFSQADVERISLEILEDITEKFGTHMIPKVLTLRLINQMISWADENQNAAAAANDWQTFAGYTAMSAQLSAAGMTIQNTYFGPDDFTSPQNKKE